MRIPSVSLTPTDLLDFNLRSEHRDTPHGMLIDVSDGEALVTHGALYLWASSDDLHAIGDRFHELAADLRSVTDDA